MEFSEKLQELRKGRSLTQEELAEALYVSRTAVSKWESGRGYPSIDSLKALSRFFSVSIDELICPDEIIEAAADEKRAFADRYRSLICGALDVLLAVLLFIPAFGNGLDTTATVALFELTGVSPWLRSTFVAIICAIVLEGACSLAVANLDSQAWASPTSTARLGPSASFSREWPSRSSLSWCSSCPGSPTPESSALPC